MPAFLQYKNNAIIHQLFPNVKDPSKLGSFTSFNRIKNS
jgi:hypothetical protein